MLQVTMRPDFSISSLIFRCKDTIFLKVHNFVDHKTVNFAFLIVNIIDD